MKKSTLFLSLAVGVALFLSSAGKAQAAMPFNFVGGSGSKPGTVNLTWTDFNNQANGYSLMYGTAPGQYQWGVPNIPEYAQNNSFTIGYLTPGQTYYVLLTAYQGNTYISQSGPIAVTAARGTMAVISTVPNAPKITQAPVPSGALFSGPTQRFQFRAVTGAKSGTVDLYWVDDGSATNYDIAFGTARGVYQWGAQGIGEVPNAVNKYTVNFLTPGKTYYFVLNAENGGNSVKGFTAEVAAVAR